MLHSKFYISRTNRPIGVKFSQASFKGWHYLGKFWFSISAAIYVSVTHIIEGCVNAKKCVIIIFASESVIFADSAAGGEDDDDVLWSLSIFWRLQNWDDDDDGDDDDMIILSNKYSN